MAAAKACIVVGVIFLLLGIGFIFVGTFGVDYELPRQKTDFLVIDSEVRFVLLAFLQFVTNISLEKPSIW